MTPPDQAAQAAPAQTRAQALAEVRSTVGLYAVVAFLWIGLSDVVLVALLDDPALRAVVGAVKGWLFVGLTAALLYWRLHRGVERRFRSLDRERQARSLVETLVDGSPDAIFAKDRAGRYLLFNRAASAVVGRDEAQVIGRDDAAIFGATQGAMIRLNDEQVMTLDRAQTFEEVVDTAGGRRTFLATKGPLRGPDGRVTGMFGIARDISEHNELARQRQLALDQANEARDLLDRMLARIDDGFVALDQDWRYTYLNHQAARMLGRDHPDQLVVRHIWTEFPDGVGHTFHRAYERAMATQQVVVLEDHYPPWDRWFENRIYPSPQGLSIYFTDITARRQAERALQVSELRYRLAASHGQVWDWDAQTGHLVIAPEFWQMMGLPVPAPEASRQQFEARLYPEDLAPFRSALRAHLRRRVRYGLEFRLRHADGACRWFRTQGQAVWNEAGRAVYMAGTTFDITERKEAEQALRESEAYRRRVFEQLADGVLLVDRSLRILDANAQAQAMLGHSREALLRLSLPALLAETEHPRLQAEMGRLLSGQAHLDEWEHRRRDGSQFPAEVSMRPLDGERHVQVLRDISARRASERALLTYQLELSELTRLLLEQEKQTTQRVAQSLHDHVGQTLAVVRLNLEATQATFGAAMPAGMARACGSIAQGLDQAVREVRHVLADLRPPMLEAQGLVAAIDNEIRARALAVDGAEVDVLIEAGEDFAALRWPADVEYGVFMVAREAIANARQHASASLIRVLLGGDAGGLALQVIDDGHGIPAPMQHGRPGHLGIVGMRERAIAIGARFSVAPGTEGGTVVSMRWEGAPT